MNKQAYDPYQRFLLMILGVILHGDENDEISLTSFFLFYFNAENVFVCLSSLFSDKISTSWIREVHAV